MFVIQQNDQFMSSIAFMVEEKELIKMDQSEKEKWKEGREW